MWSTLDGRRGSFATEVPAVLQAEPPADSAEAAMAAMAEAEAAVEAGGQLAAEGAASANNPRYRGE